jgi:hypothetical protein
MVLLTSALASIPADAAQCIALRIYIPQPEATREIVTPEGTATASLQIKDGERFATFLLDLVVGDLAAGIVLVTVRDEESGFTLDKFELRANDGEVQAATTPAFTLDVRRIFEQTGRSCS